MDKEDYINSLIDDYNISLTDSLINHIEKLKLGFVEDDCNYNIFGILIHCMENIDIFNKTQLINIKHYINKLNYG